MNPQVSWAGSERLGGGLFLLQGNLEEDERLLVEKTREEIKCAKGQRKGHVQDGGKGVA